MNQRESKMRLIKRVLVFVLTVCMVVTCIPPASVSAAASDDVRAGIIAEKKANDGIKGRLEGNVPAEFYGGKVDKSITVKAHNPRFNEWKKEKGIDVSHHQGVIDWDKVAADGIKFAFVRVAGRGYGSAGNLFEDSLYKTNLKEAKAAGLQVGVYIYSQATTQKEARDEAAYIIKRIKGYDIDLPVVFDYEYYPGGRLAKAKLTDKQRTDICKAFCEAVKFAGYEPMIYANKSMLEDDLNAASLENNYQIWLAHYTGTTDYEGQYTYWQHTSKGSVKGIQGNVDRNWHYIEPGFRITKTTATAVSMEWQPIDDAEGYVIYRKEADGNYQIIEYVEDPEAVSYTDKTVMMNTVYSYYIRYYKTDENGDRVIYKSGYPNKKTVTPLKLKKVKVTAASPDAGKVKLTWEKEPNATGYEIQRYNDSTAKYETIKTIQSVNTLSFTNTNRVAGTAYKYRIRAFADVGGALVYGYYTPVEISTLAELAKPEVTAKPYSYTTNKLSWERIPGASGYKIQRYNKTKDKWVTVKTINSGGTLKYSDTYLDCSTTYKYRVRATAAATNKTINSKYSDVVSAKTKAGRTGVVTAGPLNVRKGPGTNYAVLKKVSEGTTLAVKGSTEGWYKVRIKVNGKYTTGYVSKDYVKLK